jgi:general stress protein 26
VRTHDFDDIAAEFHERVSRIVLCNVATVDGQGRPRSRILHPIWEGSTAWISTNQGSFKSRHLARNPYVSLAYIDAVKPAYADCRAEWLTDPGEKQHVWDLYLNTPPPLGFDPAAIYNPVDGPPTGRIDFGVLKLTPYRIALYQWPDPLRIWTPAAEGDSIG